MNNYIEASLTNGLNIAQFGTLDSSDFLPSLNYDAMALNQLNMIAAQPTLPNVDSECANMLLQKLQNYCYCSPDLNQENGYFAVPLNPSQAYPPLYQESSFTHGRSNFIQECMPPLFSQDLQYVPMSRPQESSKEVSLRPSPVSLAVVCDLCYTACPQRLFR